MMREKLRPARCVECGVGEETGAVADEIKAQSM